MNLYLLICLLAWCLLFAEHNLSWGNGGNKSASVPVIFNKSCRGLGISFSESGDGNTCPVLCSALRSRDEKCYLSAAFLFSFISFVRIKLLWHEILSCKFVRTFAVSGTSKKKKEKNEAEMEKSVSKWALKKNLLTTYD